MNILVTGGAGFIGSHLVDALVRDGHRVRILDSLVEQVHRGVVPPHLNAEAEFIRADICDADAVTKALDGVEVVYHQAAEVGVAQSMYEITRYVRANDLCTATLLEAMIERPSQFKKLVVASSNTIYGEGTLGCENCGERSAPSLRTDEQLQRKEWEFACPKCGGVILPAGTPEDKPIFPTTVYAVTKLAQEQYCLAVGRAYKIPTVALRYFNVYGARQTLSNPYTGVCAIFSSRLLNGEPPVIFEDGGQSRDFVHVSDVVGANLLALSTERGDYESFNIASGRATSIRKIAELLADGLDKQIAPEVNGKYREGDIRHCIADISKASDLLGYEPKVSLEVGLAELIEWQLTQTLEESADAATAELTTRSLVR
jgi:dTDP-L-rhamnose 4-epimerase